MVALNEAVPKLAVQINERKFTDFATQYALALQYLLFLSAHQRLITFSHPVLSQEHLALSSRIILIINGWQCDIWYSRKGAYRGRKFMQALAILGKFFPDFPIGFRPVL